MDCEGPERKDLPGLHSWTWNDRGSAVWPKALRSRPQRPVRLSAACNDDQRCWFGRVAPDDGGLCCR